MTTHEPGYGVTNGSRAPLDASSASDSSGGRATQVAGETRNQASQVASDVGSKASDLAGQASQQTSDVAGEAKRHARDLAGDAREQLTRQASDQQQQAASRVHDLAGGLSRMAEGAPPEAGLAAELARQVAQRLDAVGGRLDSREPGELLEDVRSFARQRPGLFLAGALLGGFVTGRLLKGAAAAQSGTNTPSPSRSADAAPTSSGSAAEAAEAKSTVGGPASGASGATTEASPASPIDEMAPLVDDGAPVVGYPAAGVGSSPGRETGR